MNNSPANRNSLSLFTISVMLLFCSCTNNPKPNFSGSYLIGASLNQSTYGLDNQMKELLINFKRDTANPITRIYALKWQTKALEIKKRTDDISNYIDRLKRDLKIKAGLRMIEDKGNYKEDFKEDDLKSVEQLFINEGKGNELQENIEEYQKRLLSIDERMRAEFEKMTIIPQIPDMEIYRQGSFTEMFFSNTNAFSALIILSALKNDIDYFAIQLMQYCYLQVPE